MSESDSGVTTEQVRKAFRKSVDGQIEPIFQDVKKLVETDERLLHSLGELKRGRQLTIREQAVLQNILYGLISTQGDLAIHVLRTLSRIRDAQYSAFESDYQIAQELITALVSGLTETVINPLAEETQRTKKIAENLNQQFAKLTKQKEMELTIPANIEKELKTWFEERERAKKASEKYTG